MREIIDDKTICTKDVVDATGSNLSSSESVIVCDLETFNTQDLEIILEYFYPEENTGSGRILPIGKLGN